MDGVYLGLAWAFVASRYLHSAIQLWRNYVPHRFLAFAAGLLILLIMWLRFAAQGLAGA